jgi:tetratricopeptide (TPR) repeat protein
MAEEPAAPGPVRKNRIIHWNPEAGQAPRRRPWTVWRVLAWTLGGFAAFVVVGRTVVWTARKIWGPQVFASAPAQVATTAPDPNLAFVSQSKAELARETAVKGMAAVRRFPQDHPRMLEKLLLLEKSLIEGETLFGARDFGRAFAHFEGLIREINEFGRIVKVRQEAQTAYDTILLKIKELELARSLAPEALEAAFTAAGEGRQFLTEGSFDAAKKTFDSAFAQLKKAEKTLTDHVEQNLLGGQQALNKGEREKALAAFKAALEKSPGNETALQGLKRAETIDRVYAHLQLGEDLEKHGQFSQAAEAYGKAFALDKYSAAAQEGQARAERLARETEFNAAMAAAKAAETQRDWPKAIQAYEAALKVYPTKAELRKALANAKETSHRETVQKALATAFDHENKYEWEEARAAYYRVLQLEPGLADAKAGYTRAGQVVRALLEFNRLIDAAEKRVAKAEFQAGIRTFNQAMAVKPSYLPASDKVQQLRATLLAQNVPVEVTFKSDGKTFVTITNFKMLEKFETTTVKILPGDYEVIGRRKGYQDVLMLLQVRNGTPPPVVKVACNLPAQS